MIRKIKLIEPEHLTINQHSAYLIGVLCGDGFVNFSKTRKYRVKFGLNCIDLDFSKKFSSEIKSWLDYDSNIRIERQKTKFLINSKIGKRKGIRYRVDFGSSDRNFYRFMKSIKTGTRNWKIPKSILKLKNERVVCNFLRGFFDSEGTVGKRNIDIFSINSAGLLQIRDLLRKIGICEEFGKITISKHRLSIYGRENMNLFLQKIGFSMERKEEKLYKLIDSYERNYSRKIKTYEDVIKLSKQGLEPIDISQVLDLPYGTVWSWVNNKYKPLFTKRL